MNIESLLTRVWNLEIQIVPVLAAVLLAELPNVLRRRAGLPYAPIYFTVFPLRELNTDLAIYLGEDWYTDTSHIGSPRLRRRILAWSITSVTISAVFIPMLIGFFGAFFLTTRTLHQFLIIFLLYKSQGILRAIRNFPMHAVGTRRNTILLVIIYLFYLGIAVQLITQTFSWTRRFVAVGDWAGLVTALSHFLFWTFGVEYLVLTVLLALFVVYLTERDPDEPSKPGNSSDEDRTTCQL